MGIEGGIELPNYTQVPNVLFEHMADMSDAELRVVLALVRLIFGFHKDTPEPVSYSRLSQLTGMTRPAVIRGIKQATERGLVRFAGRGPRGVHLYTLNFNGDREAIMATRDRSTSFTSEAPTSKPSLPDDPQTGKRTLPDEPQTGKVDLLDDHPTSKPALPDNSPTGKAALPELVNVVYPQNKYSKEKEIPGPDGPGRAAPDPPAHVRLIDSYLASLEAVGRKPIETNPYARRAKIATAMAHAGVTPEQVRAFVAHVYDERNPDRFWRERTKPIPLETVAEQLPAWLVEKRRALTNPAREGQDKSPDAAMWSRILSSIPSNEEGSHV